MIQRKLILKLAAVIMITAAIASCKKDIDLPVDTCVAGTGGEVTLVFYPEHHGKSIPSIPGYPDSAFIKFNAVEFPGDNPAFYDLVVEGIPGDSFVTVAGLNCGKYFIFMTGKDTDLDERVKGGIPVTIEEKSGILNIDIPITED